MVIKRPLEPVRESAEVYGLESFVETHDPKFPTLAIDLIVEEIEVDAEARKQPHGGVSRPPPRGLSQRSIVELTSCPGVLHD